MVVPPLTNWLIDAFGWRGAFIGLGLGWGVSLSYCAFSFFFDAHDRAKRVRKDAAANNEAVPVATALAGLTPMEALSDSALWRVGISNFMVMVLTIGLMIHLFRS